MKSKIILSLIMTLFVIKAMSQTPEVLQPLMGKCSLGIYGGINFQNLNGKDISGDRLKNDMIMKYHLGINEQIPVAPEFYVQVGLQYAGKGARGPVSYLGTPETRQVNMNYFELPINLLYKPLLGTGHFILGFGPYIGYSFMGKVAFTGEAYNTSQNILFEKTVNASNPNDLVYFRHFDAGANAFFGYEFANRLNLVFNSQIGLMNTNSKNTYYPDSKLSEMNTGFGLSLGYRF